ncbi:probable peroxygenase 4 [Carica papaya]|uniref:probable peroxygenase 4 n=1 Tax=Carica papaya TaxID=3649 RepID=UPI000B8CF77D|nr:probable peroxygenase 4 [Carica papaya]
MSKILKLVKQIFAEDPEVEEGTSLPANQSVLQKHATFFDRNHDGIVYPWETYQGFRAVGSGRLLAVASSIFINVGLNRSTRPGKYFSPLFPIVIKNIHLAKHGSDSGVYDSNGSFVASKFEEIFSRHARIYYEALTFDELMEMVKANRKPRDHKGWIASFAEWRIFYILFKDKNGLLQKETVKAMYDGSLFERMEKEKKSSYSTKNKM